MHIILGERCSGKTTRLIEKSAETGAVIVTISVCACDYIKHQAAMMKMEIPNPISARQLVKLRHDSMNGNALNVILLNDIQKRGILIDDAEIVLPVILNDWNIHEMTLTDTSVNVEVLKSLRKIDV